MKIFIFFFNFFLFFKYLYKSNDSPNLNYKTKNALSWNEWLRKFKERILADCFKQSTLII